MQRWDNEAMMMRTRAIGTWWMAAAMVLLSGTLLAAEGAEAPAPGPAAGAETAKADPPPAGGATAAKDVDLSDPTVLQGDPPAFPLKSDNYNLIMDDYNKYDFNNDTKEMEMEYSTMEDLMVALRASSQEHLVNNLDKDVTFKMLMKEPEKYRGHVVKLIGLLAPVKEARPTPNLSGFNKIYKGQITNSNGNIVSFRSMEPLPAGLKKGDAVQVVGIFMKRYCYLNQEPGEMLTWTPLLFVRRVEPYNDFKNFTATQSPMSNAAAIIVFIFVSLAAAGYLYSRMKYKVAAANHFTRMKNEKDGPTNNVFPRKSVTPRKPPPKKPDAPKPPASEGASPAATPDAPPPTA
jgi:hypothetical protein